MPVPPGCTRPTSGVADVRPARQGTYCREARVQSVAGPTGGARHPSLDRPSLRLQRLQTSAHPCPRHHRVRPGDWTQTQIALVFTIFIVFLGLSAAVFGRWLERVGPRKAGVAAAFCWGGGYLISAIRRPHPPALAPVSRQRGDRWMRARPGLHLTGVDPDQVVPGPPRHGNRHGDHGIRRRCHDRGAAGRLF